MNDLKNTKINVSRSEGVAIGAGASVSIKKEEKHVHYHAERKKGTDDGGWIIAGMFVLVVLLLASTFFFARYAQTVYVGLRATFLAELVIVAAATMLRMRKERDWLLPKDAALIALAAVGSVALHFAHTDYGTELTEFANATRNPLEFWCALKGEWRQFALLHVVTAIGGFGISGVLLLPSVALSIAGALSGNDDDPSLASSWLWIIGVAVLLTVAALFHTPAGWGAWSRTVANPPTFFCSR
jgi:hypothetical protein